MIPQIKEAFFDPT